MRLTVEQERAILQDLTDAETEEPLDSLRALELEIDCLRDSMHATNYIRVREQLGYKVGRLSMIAERQLYFASELVENVQILATSLLLSHATQEMIRLKKKYRQWWLD